MQVILWTYIAQIINLFGSRFSVMLLFINIYLYFRNIWSTIPLGEKCGLYMSFFFFRVLTIFQTIFDVAKVVNDITKHSYPIFMHTVKKIVNLRNFTVNYPVN